MSNLPQDEHQNMNDVPENEAGTSDDASADVHYQHDALVKQSEEYLAGWKRALADFENYKRDQARHVSELQEYQQITLLREILPIMDLFDEALKFIPEAQRSEAWYQGLTHIQKQWQQLLADYSVSSLAEIGDEFNPEVHEAVEIRNDPARKDNSIINIVSKGYALRHKTIRPARVIVNKLTISNE